METEALRDLLRQQGRDCKIVFAVLVVNACSGARRPLHTLLRR